MTATAADWRERHAEKLGSASDAVSAIESGQHVYAGGWTSVPVLLCEALHGRLPELERITISTFLTPFNWDRPEILERWTVRSFYAGPFERAAVRAGRFEYIPVAQWRDGKLPPGFDEPDVALVPISAPDDEG
ncbi:MAG TPA: hypothetical protein VLA89_18135, partial [Gemmatimonadales bacterium]|nr:hypothetical protein [Gemmatimonadales bacterium]